MKTLVLNDQATLRWSRVGRLVAGVRDDSSAVALFDDASALLDLFSQPVDAEAAVRQYVTGYEGGDMSDELAENVRRAVALLERARVLVPPDDPDGRGVLERFGVLRMPDCLDRAECAEIYAQSRIAMKTRGRALSRNGPVLDSAYETNHVQLPAEIIVLVRQRLSALRAELEQHYQINLRDFVRDPLGLAYPRGGVFQPHIDWAPILPSDSHEDASAIREPTMQLVLFLNSQVDSLSPGTYAGGELVLYPDYLWGGSTVLRVRGRAGSVLAFPSFMLHGVDAVTAGERHVVISMWYAEARGNSGWPQQWTDAVHATNAQAEPCLRG